MSLLFKTCIIANNRFLPRVIPSSSSRSIKYLQIRQFFTKQPKSWNINSLKNKNITKNILRRGTAISLNLSAPASSAPKYKKPIGYWLSVCGGMVFGAVVLGGVTRLTKSGLSMVTWHLFGEKLPRNENEWIEEFERYKAFPEYKIMNRDMTLTEFKWIWYMEFVHRSWGRALGAVFAIPATIFWMKGMFTRQMKIRVLIFASLIGLQGLMGWYMVKSGLEDKFQGVNDVPRVSQYRLAAHLSMAFILYSLFLTTALEHLLPAEAGVKAARGLKTLAHTTKGFVFLTAISGAFVAGIEAGLVYNSFPKMADKWIPEDLLNYKPMLRNFTENPTTTQFDHRILGITTLSLVTGVWLLSRKHTLPRRAHLAANSMAIMAWLQVTLGISTLLYYVPVWLAACHQSGSLMLLSTALWFSHELKKLPK